MTPNTAQRDVKWVDGLRGIASALVVTAHIFRSLAPHLLSPATSENGPSLLLQRPIIRNFVMGRSSIAIFAVVSGYVNALKPIKLARGGNTEVALSGIAKSSFRRTGRFVIPSLLATTASWLLCQFGAYKVAKVSDSQWLRDTSPEPSASFPAALFDLIVNLISTWVTGNNEYDKITWTLTYLLMGSMMVYMALVATIFMKPKHRMLVCAVLYCYKWLGSDALIGTNVFAGMFLAEASLYPEIQQYALDHTLFRRISSTSLMALGLCLCSFPEENAGWAPWSRAMQEVGRWAFPENAELARFFPGVGVDLILLGVVFNSTAKNILSSPTLCWMGMQSFAIYLLHAPLIRTVLAWTLYGTSEQPYLGKDKDGNDLPLGWAPITKPWIVFLVIPLFYAFLYRVAQLWSRTVDAWSGQVTQAVEDWTFREEDEKAVLLA